MLEVPASRPRARSEDGWEQHGPPSLIHEIMQRPRGGLGMRVYDSLEWSAATTP